MQKWARKILGISLMIIGVGTALLTVGIEVNSANRSMFAAWLLVIISISAAGDHLFRPECKRSRLVIYAYTVESVAVASFFLLFLLGTTALMTMGESSITTSVHDTAVAITSRPVFAVTSPVQWPRTILFVGWLLHVVGTVMTYRRRRLATVLTLE